MLRVLACVTETHDPRLVVLAALICLFACLTAFSLVSRARGAASSQNRGLWAAAAATVTGCGVWSTHFIAMLAYRPGLPLGYDLNLTVLSVIIAVAVTWIGFTIKLSRLHQPIIGGAVAGAAIGVMHYVGMAAMQVSAVVHYDGAMVVASIALGIVLGAYAFQTHDRHPGLAGGTAAAALFAVAICGLHFTAMAAVSLDPSAMIPLPDALASPEWLAVAVTAVTLMIIVLSLAGSLMDQHLAERKASESTRLRRYVTELEATKRELEQTAAELTGALDQAAASSRAKSQFLATMSHELRTPLNAVLGFAELLKLQLYGPLGDPRYLGYAGDIHASGGHLLAVINDVLDFAKIDAGRLTLVEDEVDIPELLDSVLPMIRGAATEAGLTLSEEHEPELRLRGDRRRLKQILLNLLSNAVKFTPSGGRVKVTAERAGRDIAISVTDTGIGIDPADMPRALQAFGQIDNRLARAYEGTGLGLPLCMQLMELHGGTLTLDSAIGRGTEVTIRFPAERVITPLRVETVDPAFMPAQAEFRAAAGDD